jgi:Flp pilus assembly protein TadG
MRSTRNPRQRRRGAVTVEMAMVSMVLFLFMFALFEYGRITMMLQIMENAARAGCRQAIATASTTSSTTANATVKSVVTQALGGQPFANSTDPVISIYKADNAGNNTGDWTTTTFGNNIVVQVSGDYRLLFPTFGFLPQTGTATNSIHLNVKCMMRSEAN